MSSEKHLSVVLESICKTCDGKGGAPPGELDDDFLECPRCKGSGYVPTDIGMAFLELMRHNLIPMLQDIGKA
jgi:DnaJ-class molecular chaperone